MSSGMFALEDEALAKEKKCPAVNFNTVAAKQNAKTACAAAGEPWDEEAWNATQEVILKSNGQSESPADEFHKSYIAAAKLAEEGNEAASTLIELLAQNKLSGKDPLSFLDTLK